LVTLTFKNFNRRLILRKKKKWKKEGNMRLLKIQISKTRVLLNSWVLAVRLTNICLLVLS
jgi:hypothetical protein